MQTIKPVSRQLTDHLASVGIFLSPKPNSVFAAIAESLADVADKELEPEISSEAFALKVNSRFDDLRPNVFAKSFEDNSEDGEKPSGVLYDELCEAAINELKPIVLGIVNALKTEVNPAVNTIFENTYNHVSDHVETGGIKLAVRTDLSELAIWSNAAFLQLVDGCIDDISTKQTVSGELYFPDMEVSELLERIKTGNEMIDAEVADYLGNFNVANLVEHSYNEIFHNENATRYPGQGQLPESVVAMLLARSFIANVPEGANGLELAPFQMELARVACWHAQVIANFMKSCEVGANTDRLIISFPGQGGEYKDETAIIVCGRGYNKFLEAGGSVDAIYGSYVGPQHRQAHKILENAPALERQWMSHVAILQSANLDDFQRKFCYELRRNIMQYGTDNAITVDHDPVDVLFDDDFIIKPETAFITARPLIIAALWPNTEYNSVLNAVDAVCDKLQGIEFNEALELGIIEWLVQWSLTHVNVKAVKV